MTEQTFMPVEEGNSPFFTGLRENDWKPVFHWLDDIEIVADRINQPHEDYPVRIPDTIQAIEYLLQMFKGHLDAPYPESELARQVHRIMFPDHFDQAGQWRRVDVRVATHIAPKHQWLDKLMRELDFRYSEVTVTPETLQDWYFDFETIHPFVDGNGRAGGVVIAAISKLLTGRFLTPGQ